MEQKPKIFEVTTIAGKLQKYEEIEVSPAKLPNGDMTICMRSLSRKKEDSCSDELAVHSLGAYFLTGLDESIKQYPSKLLMEHDGERFRHAEIIAPERLRLIYDAFPLWANRPILRICPVKGNQIYISEYNFKNARLPLEEMTFSQEFEGSLDLLFTGLQVFLHLRNFERENGSYYGRDLKKSYR